MTPTDTAPPAAFPAPARPEPPVGETVLRDGTRAMIWPLLPSDGEGLRAGFSRLSAGSRRSRFLAGRSELDDALLRRLVEGVDGRRHVALVLVALPDGGEERPVGVARLVQDRADPAGADIAVTVADDWHGRGVGTALARALLARRPPGVRRLDTTVEADNAASLALLGRLGRLTRGPASWGVVDVRVALDDA